MVYIARYLDLFLSFISVYNTVMKMLFIAASCATVYLIYVRFKATYDGNHDTFRIELAIIPSLILAFIFHYNMSFLEVSDGSAVTARFLSSFASSLTVPCPTCTTLCTVASLQL